MLGLGVPELIIIAVIIVLLFGSTRLPKLARSLGQARHEFAAGTKDAKESPSEREHDVKLTSSEYQRLLADRERTPKE